MATNQEGVQAALRDVTGLAYTYNGDWHALWDNQGTAGGTYNERMLAFINDRLGTTYQSLPRAQQAFAEDQGFDSWSAMNTLALGEPAPEGQWDYSEGTQSAHLLTSGIF